MKASDQTYRWQQWGAIALLLLAYAPAQAASVVFGNHLLLPNTPNQVITIEVTGGEQVAGEDFYAQIGDGGTFNGGSNSKPSFTNVDILTGTIFASNHKEATGDPSGSPPGSNAGHPLIWVDGMITASGTVSSSGLLATLTVDTTGLNAGTFPLLLTGVANSRGQFDTKLYNGNGDLIPLTVTGGSLLVSSLPLPDYNHNGLVDAADYTVWRDTFGQMVTIGSGADGDHDGAVTAADYNLWKAEFGYSAPGSGAAAAATAVPEPPTVALLAIALIAWVVIARRRQRWPRGLRHFANLTTTPQTSA